MRAAVSRTIRHRVGAAIVCLAAAASSGRAQDSTVAVDSARAHRDRLLMIGAAAVGAATFGQATAIPHDWQRTWHGYGARLGDQLGFATVEESTRLLLERMTPWHAVAQPCAGARRGRAFLPRVWSAGGCALRSTFVARDERGRTHLNVPLVGAVVTASATSLAWRPERRSASKGQAFVATRIGVVFWGTTAGEAFRLLRAK